MLKHNKTYKSRGWVWTDPEVNPIEPSNNLYYLVEKIKTLFQIDDIIAGKALDKRRQSLLELVISGCHRAHLLWLLTQSYTAIPKNIRRQAKMLYFWYPKSRTDLNIIHEENDIIEMHKELTRVKKKLKQGKHTSLIMRMEHPRAYEILWVLQDSYQEITELLSRDYSTPVNRLQHSYQEIAALLSRDYSTLIKRLQHSCQEITALLSRDYSTPVKRFQHSYQEIAALLSRDCSTPASKT